MCVITSIFILKLPLPILAHKWKRSKCTVVAVARMRSILLQKKEKYPLSFEEKMNLFAILAVIAVAMLWGLNGKY